MRKLRFWAMAFYCILAMIGVLVIAVWLTGCNVYEHEEVEIRRCPQVQDTILLPGWDHMER